MGGEKESMRKSRKERKKEGRDGSLRIPSASVSFTGCLRSRKKEDEGLEGPAEKVEAIEEEKERMGFEAIFGPGHARKIYRRTGKLLPDVRFRPVSPHENTFTTRD